MRGEIFAEVESERKRRRRKLRRLRKQRRFRRQRMQRKKPPSLGRASKELGDAAVKNAGAQRGVAVPPKPRPPRCEHG
jgi:hypothetical protein